MAAADEAAAPPALQGARLVAKGVPRRLQDPLGNRPVSDVPAPAFELLDSKVFWEDLKKNPNLRLLEDHLLAEGLLTQELMLEIIAKAKEEFSKEPNLFKLRDPITIVGDIHGQFYDLRQLLDLGGNMDSQYLFLGDYVDRGAFSIEVITYLFATKILKPDCFRMLRGNHESRQMTAFFNFREECEYKYDVTVYDALMDCFDCLPIAATVNSQFFCVHGGLSPSLKQTNDIQGVYRFQEPPEDGLLCDLLWSDPTDQQVSKNDSFLRNDVRGCAWYFTFHHTAHFLKYNNLLTLIRAHEVQFEGFKMHKKIQKSQFPSCITVFSAPNYCDSYGNKGAVLMLENSTLNVKQFHYTEHPYHLPNFMNVFEWSLPFMAEKVTEIMALLMAPLSEEEEQKEINLGKSVPLSALKGYRQSMNQDQTQALKLLEKLTRDMGAPLSEKQDEQDNLNRERIRQKAFFLGRMARMYKVLREENETILQLKGALPDKRLAPGLLLAGKEGLKNEMDLFNFTGKIDKRNEMRPYA